MRGTLRSTLSSVLLFLSSVSPAVASEQQPFEFGEMSAPQYTLPPLPYAYNALEPHISAQIMELHHSKHHQTYITNLNALLKTQAEAVSALDIPSQVAVQQGIKFNAGGHINHSLFWQNLAPASSSEAKSAAAPELVKRIKATWGDEDKFKEAFNAALLGIQGSGWGWLVKTEVGKEQRLSIVTTKDQDPVVGKGETPIFGVDMWEHAYYLQYQNGKAAYVQNIWNVINWKTAEERYLGSRADAFSVLKASIILPHPPASRIIFIVAAYTQPNMCNGASTRTTQGGSIAVLHPIHPPQRIPSSSSISSSSCSSSDDEDQQPQANEILVFFSNTLSKTSGTNVEVHGLHEQLKQQDGYIVIHRDGDLSSPTCTPASQDTTALCSFAIQRHARSWALERKLDLGVGDTGIIGRRVSVVTATREMLAQGIVGWN
ncbi:uncharacterized protein yc1106_09542 [Curvularia clavata]|uniref:Superoxide dismutase [Mn], mitochondrial n=1 Tax=Curvularia clavata TaxID=95742 RepID=A0A9Q9DVJ8_CURCL|nr:uncharacterized protein yc1106_09542 [Curvularia clavata]